MTEREMFEKSFERPKNFLQLSAGEQWDIDKRLGILDWQGKGLSVADKKRLKKYFNVKLTEKK